MIYCLYKYITKIILKYMVERYMVHIRNGLDTVRKFFNTVRIAVAIGFSPTLTNTSEPIYK